MTCQPTSPTLLHIAVASEWETSVNTGSYAPSAWTETGFVHLCTPAQLEGVANAFYRGRDDLVLLEIDRKRLDRAALKWEPPLPPDPSRPDPAPAGSLFPHLYGPIPVSAVQRASRWVADEGGVFRRPARLSGS